MRDKRTTNNEQQLKIELLSQWKLEAESRKLSLNFYRTQVSLVRSMDPVVSH